MVLMALFAKRSIFSGSCACIVESVVDLVSTLNKEVQMSRDVD